MLQSILAGGLHVFYENVEGYEERAFTHVRVQGRSRIDFVIVNKEAKKEVESMRIKKSTDSDHRSVVVNMKRMEEEEEKMKKHRERED